MLKVPFPRNETLFWGNGALIQYLRGMADINRHFAGTGSNFCFFEKKLRQKETELWTSSKSSKNILVPFIPLCTINFISDIFDSKKKEI